MGLGPHSSYELIIDSETITSETLTGMRTIYPGVTLAGTLLPILDGPRLLPWAQSAWNHHPWYLYY